MLDPGPSPEVIANDQQYLHFSKPPFSYLKGCFTWLLPSNLETPIQECSLTALGSKHIAFTTKLEMNWGCSSVGSVLDKYARSPGFNPRHHIKAEIVMYACTSSPREVEAAGRSDLTSHKELNLWMKGWSLA